METPENKAKVDDGVLQDMAHKYCSKIVAGVDAQAWRDRVMPLWPPSDDTNRRMEWMKKGQVEWLPPVLDGAPSSNNNNLGWGNARAKVAVQQGERLEMGTALLMSLQKHVQGTALRPLTYAWDDLYPQQQQVLQKMLQQPSKSTPPPSYKVQYQGPNTDWQSVDILDDSNLSDLVLFPASGHIGMVVRSSFLQSRSNGDETSMRQPPNCKLVIHEQMPSQKDSGGDSDESSSVGVTIELVATADIAVGELLVLDLPPNHDTSDVTHHEFTLLYQELRLTGQLYNKDIFKTAMAKRRRKKREEKKQESVAQSDEL